MPPAAKKVQASAASPTRRSTQRPAGTDNEHASPDTVAVPTGRLTEGDVAPDFQLADADGQSVALSQFRGRHVILYFYPAAATPGCTTEAGDFRDNLTGLEEAGYAVLGISPDAPAKLQAFRDAEGLTFPLLSDPTRAVLQAYGAFGTKTMYGKQVQGVIRSTFVIGPSGVVEKAMYNVRATGHVAKLLRELDASV